MSPPAPPPTVSPGPTPATSDPAAPKPSFLRRRIVGPITARLTQGITPGRIAFTLGLGVALSLFPFLGFTMILCFVVAAALKLTQPITQILNQLLWPVWIPPTRQRPRPPQLTGTIPKPLALKIRFPASNIVAALATSGVLV